MDFIVSYLLFLFFCVVLLCNRDYIGKRSSDDSSSSEEIIINDRDRFEELYQAIDEVENITSKDNNEQEAYPTLGDLLGIKPK